jgi:hypothetical protein
MSTESVGRDTGERSRFDPMGFGLRIPDLQDALAGPITAMIIDADKDVRATFNNGFPNWDMYRIAIAGDNIYTRRLIDWCVAFSVVHCECGGVRKDAYSDELGVFVGWDAACILIHCRPLFPYTEAALDVGVDHKTYKRVRDQVVKRLKLSLEDYLMELCSAYFHVIKSSRKSG